MNINTMKMIEKSISRILATYEFIGEITVNLLYEDIIDNDTYIAIYFFAYEDEVYHIIVVYVNNELYISLNNEIAKSIVK